MQAAKTSLELSQRLREKSLRMVHAAKASHIGGALSMCDLLGVLYSDILCYRPEDPDWTARDRLILSKGHSCAALYAALAEVGYFPLEELTTYGANESRLMTHISHKVPGVEFSTGSLGHGLSFGCGKALAAKKKQRDWRTFVIASDGELDEGSNREAILCAPQHRLDNLVLIIDYNKMQSLGSVENVMSLEPLVNKFKAFNWAVREVDGHDHSAIREVLKKVPWERGRPSCLIAHTTKGKGVPFMENQVLWHYRNPNDEQLTLALKAIREGV